MRPEELVRRADEDVHVPRGDVDRAVRPVVHGVGPGERARLVRELDDAPDVRRGPDGVRGDGKADDARPVREEPREIVVVDLEVLGDTCDAHDDPEVVRELEPRRHVRVVVELRDDDLVARAERPRERAREQEVECGHARPERDLVGRRPEEGRGALTRPRDELVGSAARLVRRADVRVRLAQVAARSRRSPSSGHCVPPGPSKNASGRSSALNCARTAVTSRVAVLMSAPLR